MLWLCRLFTQSKLINKQGCREGRQLGHFALGPTLLMGSKRSIYSNRTVKYSIKAVTIYIYMYALGPSSSLGCPVNKKALEGRIKESP